MLHGSNHEREGIRFKISYRNRQVIVEYGPKEEPEELGLQHLNL